MSDGDEYEEMEPGDMIIQDHEVVIDAAGNNASDDASMEDKAVSVDNNNDSESDSASSSSNSSSSGSNSSSGSDDEDSSEEHVTKIKMEEEAETDSGPIKQEPDNDDNSGEADEQEAGDENQANHTDGFDLDEILRNTDENGIYKWPEFVGAKVRDYTREQYYNYQKPFEYGWKRELVLRVAGSTSEKKAGDVYYHPPDGTTKLRSYVELKQYLRRYPNMDLTIDSFCYSKQPVYHPPDEIVRFAMQRGINFINRPFSFNQHIKTKHHLKQLEKRQQLQPPQDISPNKESPSKALGINTSTTRKSATPEVLSPTNTNEDSNEDFGRGKRKRVLPSRFEETEVDLLPGKKSKRDGSYSNGNSQDATGTMPSTSSAMNNSTTASSTPSTSKNASLLEHSSSGGNNSLLKRCLTPSTSQAVNLKAMTAQERRRTLQQQLYLQVHEEQMRKEREQQQNQSHDLKVKLPKSMLSSALTRSKPPTPETCDAGPSQQDGDKSMEEGVVSTARNCTINCPGRRAMVPNLMCSRCFLLFHLECVPDGIFLEEPTVFICPNCLQPEDREKAKGGMSQNLSSSVTLTPINGNAHSLLEGNLNSNSLLMSKPSSSHQGMSRFAPKQNGFKMGYAPHQPQPSKQVGYKWSSVPSKATNGMMNGMKNMSRANGYSFGKKKPIVPPLPKSIQQQVSSQISFKPAPYQVLRIAQSLNGQPIVIKDKGYPNTSTPTGASSASTSSSGMPLNARVSNFLRGATKNLHEKQTLLHAAKQLAKQYCESVAASGGSLNKSGIDLDKLSELISGTRSSVNTTSKYYRYLARRGTILNSFSGNFDALTKIFDYLDLKDLLSLRQTSRTWYQLSSLPSTWHRLQLRGLTVTNWDYLGAKLISQARDVDLTGVRIPVSLFQDQGANLGRMSKISQFWSNLASIHHCFTKVELLRFGAIPFSALRELLASGSLTSLRSLSISNLLEDDNESASCSVEVVSVIATHLPNLTHLQIDSHNGLILPEETRNATMESLCTSLKTFTQLRSFTSTSLKEFTLEEWSQLVAQFDTSKITELALGSVSKWLQTDSPNLLKQLGQFVQCTSLRLRDISIGPESSRLADLFESMILVERLALEDIHVNKNGSTVWSTLKAMFKSLPLRELRFTTDDPFTNRSIFELAHDLLSTQKRTLRIVWAATVTIDDLGHCFIPLSLDHFTTYDFVKTHFRGVKANDTEADQLYQLVPQNEQKPTEGQMLLVELSTLADMLNRRATEQQLCSYIQIMPQ